MSKNTIVKVAVPALLIILFAFGYFLFFNPDPVEEVEEEIFTKEEAELLSREWIENYSPTYHRDGYNLNLQEIEETEQGVYEIVFTFIKPTSGYGDKKTEDTQNIPTGHRVVVMVESGKVVSVINDNHFDEMENDIVVLEFVEHSISLYFIKEINGSREVVKTKRMIAPEETEDMPEIFLETEEDIIVFEAEFFVKELLKGPSQEKKQGGIFTIIPEEAKILQVNYENKVLYLDFNKDLYPEPENEENVSLIKEQVTKTTEEMLRLFHGIEAAEVVITVEGEVFGE